MRTKCFKCFDEIKSIINIALKDFYENESALLDVYSSERSMVFHIGWYVLKEIERHDALHDMDVDCEYNRHMNNPKRIFIDGSGLELKIPDLLIHKRNTDDMNLLVVEFKKEDADPDEKDSDRKTLKAFTNQESGYNYCYGLFIELKNNHVEVEVYMNGQFQNELSYIYSFKS